MVWQGSAGDRRPYADPTRYLGNDASVHNDRMPSSEGAITHVSDTALMVAACRAHEAELDDAFVSDPFAARLCGERGFAILRELPYANVMRIGMAIRTRFLDDLLLEALQMSLDHCSA